MSHDDFEREPIPGLPAHLPEGEEIKWQGTTDQGAFAKHVLHRNKIAAYFVIVAVWKFSTTLYDGGTLQAALTNCAFMIGLGLIVMAIIWWFARAVARTTVYTITNNRVVMRFGVALPVTFNYPFKQIISANVQSAGNDTGTIALAMKEHTKISWAILWPHARPWKFAKPEPAFRMVKDLNQVSQILSHQLNEFHQQNHVPTDVSAEDRKTSRSHDAIQGRFQGQQA